MRYSLPQAVILFSLATCLPLAAAKASQKPAELRPADITSVAGTTDNDHVAIEFPVPCIGCTLDSETDHIILNLRIDATTTECISSTIRINGVPLSPSGYGDPSQGLIEISPPSDTNYRNRLWGSWQLLCLGGEASLLMVNINGANAIEFRTTPGFVASFRQHSSPTSLPSIIRLQGHPSGAKILQQPKRQIEWLHPLNTQRVSVSYPSLPGPQLSTPVLEQKLRELTSLEDQTKQLQMQREQIEKDLLEFMSTEYSQCTSWTCMINTAVENAPGYAKLIKNRFHFHSFRTRQLTEQVLRLPEADIDAIDNAGQSEDEKISDKESKGDLSSTLTLTNNQHVPMCDKQEHDAARGRFGLLSYIEYDGRRRSKQFYLNMVVLGLCVSALTCATIFAVGLYIWTCVYDPRRRAERAARREERETRRLYRKAARSYRWSRLWKRWKHPIVTDDYEEKRATLVQRGGLHEDVIQRQMNNLRAAHDMVADLVRAEEGRAHNPQSALPPSAQPGSNRSISESGEGSSRRSETLPPYSPPPPEYETELTEELSIVDSFEGYLPSSVDDSPDSSVVDCSPRLSFETQRTTFTTRSED